MNDFSPEKFKSIYYIGRIVRHRGERKVIAKASINNEGGAFIVFVDGTKCKSLIDIELDGRK
jgi:hypothetical protein